MDNLEKSGIFAAKDKYNSNKLRIMKKRFTTFFALLMIVCGTVKAQDFESAADAVKNMGVGWNLGNTLDANNQTISDITNDAYWGQQGLDSETCWGQPYTTKEFIQMMKKAGFTAIRVPVTWYNHLDKDGNVNEEWMKRVKEVVDYVISEGLYCILNVHHDTGADSKDANGKLTGYHWIKADADNYNENKDRYVKLWSQIAEEFKDYGQTLLFEAYKEMLDGNSCWNYPTFGMDFDADYEKKSLEAVNSYAQSFVSTVRLSGGNNATRNLIVNPYAAASGGVWGNNTHPQDPLEQLVLPTDESKDHLIVEVHSYPEITKGLSSAKSGLDWTFNNLNEKIIQRLNVPLIVGEWGTSNVDNGSDYIDRRETMIGFCDYFVKKAKEYGIATFYWMGLSDGNSRKELVFNQPDLAETITKAYHGDDFKGEYPAKEAPSEGVIFEGEQMLEWGSAINLAADLFTNLSDASTVEITYVQQYDQFEKEDDRYGMMQFWYNDWSTMINVTAEGQTFNGDFVPSDVYGTESGTEHVTTFSFDKETFHNFKKKGMLFQGHGIIVKKVVLNGVAEEQEPPQGGGDSEVFWEGDAVMDWGDGLQLTVPAENFAAHGQDVRLTLQYTIDMNGDSDYNMIQLFYGDWSTNPSFIIDGQTIDKEFRPTDLNGAGNGDACTTTMTFSEDVMKIILEKGIVMQGHGLRLNKVILETPSGIKNVLKAKSNDGAIYNLAGQRVYNPQKGIYIKNGKKFIVK